tara:strand:- start:677 stop:910 length:234 start_codon:yes stop_codon:yes gene_type:complete
MKIKVKRYKEIEQIALLEATEKILMENLELGGEQLRQAITTLKTAGMPEGLLDAIEGAIATAAASIATGEEVAEGER